MTAVEIISFGYLHDTAPEADLTFDLRRHFRDPHVSPELRHMTANDEQVRLAVRNTPGIIELVEAAAEAVAAYVSGPSGGKVVVAAGCAGGRHRAPSFALLLAELLLMSGADPVIRVIHRDLHQPVVQR
jgi:UPF0042 nucleotide-binding protein